MPGDAGAGWPQDRSFATVEGAAGGTGPVSVSAHSLGSCEHVKARTAAIQRRGTSTLPPQARGTQEIGAIRPWMRGAGGRWLGKIGLKRAPHPWRITSTLNRARPAAVAVHAAHGRKNHGPWGTSFPIRQVTWARFDRRTAHVR